MINWHTAWWPFCAAEWSGVSPKLSFGLAAFKSSISDSFLNKVEKKQPPPDEGGFKQVLCTLWNSQWKTSKYYNVSLFLLTNENHEITKIVWYQKSAFLRSGPNKLLDFEKEQIKPFKFLHFVWNNVVRKLNNPKRHFLNLLIWNPKVGADRSWKLIQIMFSMKQSFYRVFHIFWGAFLVFMTRKVAQNIWEILWNLSFSRRKV